ncbi:hypothetical protein [Endozoicomonas numazuensis]|uniref:Uncharacterized protein n=1 Tax=Endozoicomonas numazuensis TaxID=1137799 RepID=A0A081NLH1_9GAMM|nr:hypothetical protein [Endozoicomonas numazuensis]KEQ19294.1 hypothetical protein GZ78_04750 [Endozoicomonas numazuensis]
MKGIDHILCDHTIVNELLPMGNCHFIDTGAFTTDKLTVMAFDSLKPNDLQSSPFPHVLPPDDTQKFNKKTNDAY